MRISDCLMMFMEMIVAYSDNRTKLIRTYIFGQIADLPNAEGRVLNVTQPLLI